MVEIQTRAGARKRSPAPAPGVAEQRTPRRVVVAQTRRSSRLKGVSADSIPSTPWYDRVPFTTPIRMSELKSWLAIMWRASLDTPNQFKHLWSTDRGVSYLFASSVMSRDRAAEIYRCFKFSHDQVLDIQSSLNDATQRNWIAATVAVVDESMAPTKIRKNPHHVFIARKPKSNGIKIWMTVDFSGVVIKMSMFERVLPDGSPSRKESTSDTLLRMIQELPEGTVIVGDSLFGSLDAVQALAEQGYEAILSCRTDRPSALFAHMQANNFEVGDVRVAQCFVRPKSDRSVAPGATWKSSFRSDGSVYYWNTADNVSVHQLPPEAVPLKEKLDKEAHAQYKCALAAIQALDLDIPPTPELLSDLRNSAYKSIQNTKPVVATSQLVGKKKRVNTLATVGSTALSVSQQTRLVRDDDDDARQQILADSTEKRPQVRMEYTDLMEFVDEVDRVILASMPFFRWNDWGAVVVFQELTVAAINNAKHFFRSGSGKTDPISPSDWIMMVYDAWVPQCHLSQQADGVKRSCKICAIEGRRSLTTWRCNHCDAICKHCAGICSQPRSRGRKRLLCSKSWCDGHGSPHLRYATGLLRPANPTRSRLAGEVRDAKKARID